MQALAQPSPGAQETYYYLHRTQRGVLLLGIGVPFFILPIMIAVALWPQGNTERITGLVAAAVLMLGGSGLLWQARRWANEIYLRLSSDGVLFHTQTITIVTPWSNMESIQEGWLHPRIVLRKPAAVQIHFMLEQKRRRGIPFDREIPLGDFGYRSRPELREHLRQLYAQYALTQRREGK